MPRTEPGLAAVAIRHGGAGNGYRYRTYNAIGFTMLGDLVDDGGCEQSLLAGTWIQVYSIPINSDPGGSVFEIAAISSRATITGGSTSP